MLKPIAGISAAVATVLLGLSLVAAPASAQWDEEWDTWGYNEGIYEGGIGENDWYYDRYSRAPAYDRNYGAFEDYTGYYEEEDEGWF